jgi:hypothetical protein
MKASYGLVCRTAFALAILCTGLLVYNMVAMPIFKDQVFLERGKISTGGEMVILLGFILVPIFNILSVLWVSLRMRKAQTDRKGDYRVLALGVLCLFLLVGEKVMVDEIGREYRIKLSELNEVRPAGFEPAILGSHDSKTFTPS